jgi:glucosyl-dolichyl phosphate glucuronosyltransferase
LTTVSVIVAAYTMKRWTLLCECMDSVLAQTYPIEQVVLCIDNNEELYQLAHRTWHETGRAVVLRNPDDSLDEKADAHARAHGSRRRFGAGTARNAGVAVTSSDVVAIIDDDARAEPDWLENLLRPYADSSVVAVGGPPVAEYETARPSWFPRDFDWVFGCEYAGLPTRTGPLRHLIGANMSFRRSAFDKVGGFHSIDFDDLDVCMRLGHAFGHGAVMYEPDARVHHHVRAERTTWKYFWRRCFFVNM